MAAVVSVFLCCTAQSLAAAPQAADPDAWTTAVGLMRAEQPQAALPHLEKLVRAHPDVSEYRLELAYALFKLGQDGRARYHFEQVKGADLSADQINAVNVLLSQISRRKTWSVRLGFSLEPSSNAGRGTVASTVAIGDLIFSVPEALQSKPATGVIVSAGVTVLPKINQTLSAVFSLDTLVRHYDDRRLRETLIVGRGGLRFHLAPNTYVEGGLITGRSFVAGDTYSDRYGVYASGFSTIGQRASASLGIEHTRLTHRTFTDADGARNQISGSFAYALSGQSLLRARAFVLHTDAASALQSGWQGGLTLGGSYAFQGGLVTLLDVTAGIDKRDGTGGLTGIRRLDKSIAVEAEFFNSNYKVGRFLPVLKMKYERNTSNITLNSYSNRSVSLGIRTDF